MSRKWVKMQSVRKRRSKTLPLSVCLPCGAEGDIASGLEARSLITLPSSDGSTLAGRFKGAQGRALLARGSVRLAGSLPVPGTTFSMWYCVLKSSKGIFVNSEDSSFWDSEMRR
ncbi:hypothetical protein TcWFU_008908 [Taenia crassiceps]|uniref:Uncharacterized protein n=1 Tax=Taenia crassiceps TaxID=6207 RepID=A0ABR4Q368_9CEST